MLHRTSTLRTTLRNSSATSCNEDPIVYYIISIVVMLVFTKVLKCSTGLWYLLETADLIKVFFNFRQTHARMLFDIDRSGIWDKTTSISSSYPIAAVTPATYAAPPLLVLLVLLLILLVSFIFSKTSQGLVRLVLISAWLIHRSCSCLNQPSNE